MVVEKGAKLLLVGCGKMGGALLEGWLARGLRASDAIVAEPVEAFRPKKAGLRAVASSQEISETPEIVVQVGDFRLVDSPIRIAGYQPEHRPPPKLDEHGQSYSTVTDEVSGTA